MYTYMQTDAEIAKAASNPVGSLPLTMGDQNPMQYNVSSVPKEDLDKFSRFRTGRPRVRLTD